VSDTRAILTIASIKWRLLLGGIRGGRQQQVQTVIALLVSLGLGIFAFALLSAVGRGAAIADDLIPVLCAGVVLGLGLLSASTGVESSLDPRHLASEPLSRWTLGLGMLAAAVVGPPAVLAGLTGIGIVVGWSPASPGGIAVVAAAVVAWWVTLLLFGRTFANLLGVAASGRLQQLAQVTATLSALLAWAVVQLLVANPSTLDDERWATLSGWAQWTPPGQLGQAIAVADRPGAALVHLALGLSWLPVLLWVSVLSTERLALSAPRPGGGRSGRAARREGADAGLLGRLLPATPAGAIARRTIRTKVRTPRQAVNTLTALAIGAGVVLVGPVFDASVDARVVIVGGLLHFAVLFDGNNSFGMDGPAIWAEVATGADAGVLVRGKVMSSLVVMSIPAVVLPLSLAALTGGWAWVGAGWLVAAGSVLGAAGVAVASAALAPVALPDSPNPLAGGDTGQGCVAGLMLAACMFVLGVASLPVAAVIYLASERSAVLATVAAVAAPAVGALVLWAGVAVARGRISGAEEVLVAQVTPAR